MIILDGISKAFKNGQNSFYALEDISVEIPENKITIISGPSGCGKSTLLSIIGFLQTATSGKVYFNEENVASNETSKKRRFINENISYVFQEFNLIDDFSVADNLLLVCDDLSVIDQILEMIGLYNKKLTPTKLLSGGEKQRLSIGRAIAKSGNIVLLDEPTGNLDEENGKIVFELLRKFSKNKTIVVVTHDVKLAYNYADYVIMLNSGKISSTFFLSQNSFDVDFNQSGIDSFIPLMEFIKYKAANQTLILTVSSSKCKKEYLVNSSKILSTYNTIYNDFKEQKVTIEAINDNKENNKYDSLSMIKKTKPIFSFRFLFKYSTVLFKNKIWRNISSIILLILNIVMIFVYTNIAAFDYASPTKRAIVENNAYFAQPYILESNDVTTEISRYFSGENLFNTLQESELKAIPLLKVSSNVQNMQLSLVIIDEPTYFRDTLVATPSLDHVVITNFISHFATDSAIIISTNNVKDMNFNYSLKIENIVNCNASSQDFDNFIDDSNFLAANKDKYGNDLSLAFISFETFTKIKNSSILTLPASNIFMNKQTMKLYSATNSAYAIYDQNQLIAGRQPKAKDEVVISSSYFNQYKNLSGVDSVNELLEREYFYKNLESSPNRDLYQTTMNLFEITPKVKIVGITDDKKAQVYITNFYRNAINEKKNLYLTGFLVNLKLNLEKITNVEKGDVYYDLSYLEPIVLIKNLGKTDLFYIILVAIAIILVSTIIFLALTFILNVKEKYKEIAILKSFGISKKRISIIFFLINFFISLISLGIGLLLSTIALHYLNVILMGPTVFSINYSLLSMTAISFIIVISITIIAALISTLIALRKVNNIDVALALKMF